MFAENIDYYKSIGSPKSENSLVLVLYMILKVIWLNPCPNYPEFWGVFYGVIGDKTYGDLPEDSESNDLKDGKEGNDLID